MARRELDYKLLKLNMTRKHPLDLEDFPEYRDRIIDRLGGQAYITIDSSRDDATRTNKYLQSW